jgi:hypothetical protein
VVNHTRKRTPIYSYITERFPYIKPLKTDILQTKSKTDDNLTREEALLGFCEIPRMRGEIADFLQISRKCYQWIADKYTAPLVDCGKLKMTLPNQEMSKHQRLVAATAAGAIPTDEAILEFCADPKSRAEINEHFGLSTWDSWTHIPPLVDSGRLHLTIPSIGTTSHRQKYTTMEVNAPALTDETLKAFCAIPRSRAEIAEYFNLEIVSARRYIAAQAEKGAIQRTIPDKPDCPSQRFTSGTV